MRPSLILEIHRQEIRNLEERYKSKGLCNFRIFGSVANQTDTEESDIDFLVDTEDGVGLLLLGALYSDLEKILQLKVDLLTTKELPNRVKERILMEAKPI